MIFLRTFLHLTRKFLNIIIMALQKDITEKTAEEADAWLKEYCRRFQTKRVACYCNSCFAGLKQGLPEGKAAVHVAELLFP